MTIVAGALALCTLGDAPFFLGPPHVAEAAPEVPRDPAAEHRLAREEANRGIAAAKEARWEDARNAFERAYTLWSKASFLFNLAGAQAKTGRLVEAAESYRAIVVKPQLEASADEKKSAAEALASLEPRIAHIRIVVRGGTQPDDGLSIDNHSISIAAVAADWPANPGVHEVALKRVGWKTPPARITLNEGETRAVTLVPVADPKPVGATSSSDRPTRPASSSSSSSSITSSPWFWIGVGVVVVGGTVTAVCLAGACSSDDPTPTKGTAGNVTFP